MHAISPRPAATARAIPPGLAPDAKLEWPPEAAAERSAVVLDALIQLEKGGLSDAHLVQEALKFKANYLREHHETPVVEELTQAWNALRPRGQ